MDSDSQNADASLVDRCLAGDRTAQECFHQSYHQELLDYLISSGADRSDATDLCSNFLNECIFGSEGKDARLTKWSPNAPLLAWLRRSIKNYFRDFVRKRSRQQDLNERFFGEPSIEDAKSAAGATSDDSELLAEALRQARLSVSAEDYVLSVLTCHGVKQGAIASLLGYSDAKVSRKIAACLQKLKMETLGYIHGVDPHFHFSWEDLASIATQFLNEPTEEDLDTDQPEDYDLDLGEENESVKL